MTRRTTRRTPTRAGRRAAWVTAAVVALAGCASVPSSGPVTEAAAGPPDEELAVRYEAPGPVPGATPTEVVLGFLDAQQAYPASVETASQFLTSDAAAAWRPSTRTVVYDQVRTQGTVSDVELAARRVATVSARGDYRAEPTPVLRPDREFSLVRVNGEWRIENPPDATYVSQSAFERYYRPYALYFLDVSRSLLVPEPVWLPSGTQLPTLLLRGLLDGPSQALGDAVSNAVPGDAESVSTVLTSAGVAEVRLPASAASLSEPQRELLSAQLVWTLGQVPEVNGVRILLGDAPIAVDGVPEVQPVGSWQSFDPTDPPVRGQLFGLRRGRLVAVSQEGAAPFTGRYGESAQGIGDFDVNLRFTRIAALSSGGGRILVGRLAGPADARPEVRYTGRDLLGPSWDRYGQLWVVDRDSGGSRVLVITADGVRDVGRGVLARSRVLSYAVSPDGSRFAAVIRSAAEDGSDGRRGAKTDAASGAPRVVIGRIVRAEGRGVRAVDRMRPLVTAPGTLARVLDLTWRDPTELVVLARLDGSLPEPYTVRIDGSQVSGGLLTGATPLNDPGVVGVESSGNPEDPVYVADRRGRLLYQDDAGRWVSVSSARLRFPNFPG